MDASIQIHGAEVLDGHCLHRYATIYNAKKYKKRFNNIRYAKSNSRDQRDHGHIVNLFNYTQKRNSENVSSPLAPYKALKLPIGKSCGDGLDILAQVDTKPEMEKALTMVTIGEAKNHTVGGGPAVGESCGGDPDMLVQVDTESDTESLYEVITEMMMGDVENPTVDGGPAVDGNPPEDGKVLPGEGI